MGVPSPSVGLQVAELLSRMALAAEPSPATQAVRVHVPPTRSDVLHECDVIEVCVLTQRPRNHSLYIWKFCCPDCAQPCLTSDMGNHAKDRE